MVLTSNTLIVATSSTIIKQDERDPEMHQAKKGDQWCYGMKVHTGMGTKSGLIDSVQTVALGLRQRIAAFLAPIKGNTARRTLAVTWPQRAAGLGYPWARY